MADKKLPIEVLLDKVNWESLPGNVADNPDNIPVATHKGVLEIGTLKFTCWQLDDGRRVFDVAELEKLFGEFNVPSSKLTVGFPETEKP